MNPELHALWLGLISAASVITTTFWNQWSVSGPTSSSLLGPIWAWRGLFGECMQYQGGQSQCQGQNSMFLMSGYKLALRGMMISSIILSSLSYLGILIGGQFSKILDRRKGIKRKLIFSSGIGFLLSGVLTLVTVAWYTYTVYDEFFEPATQDNYIQWELGACVYLGYISSFLSVLTFSTCTCCFGQRNKKNKKKSRHRFLSRYHDVKRSRDNEPCRNSFERCDSCYRHERKSESYRTNATLLKSGKNEDMSFKFRAFDPGYFPQEKSKKNKNPMFADHKYRSDIYRCSEYV